MLWRGDSRAHTRAPGVKRSLIAFLLSGVRPLNEALTSLAEHGMLILYP